MSAPIHHLETVDSTNDHLRMLAERGAVSETAVVATTQTAGRGRHGSSWESAHDESIYVSVLYRPQAVAAALAGLTLDVATAIAEAFVEIELPIGLEWPNDLVVDGKKLGGILCELHTYQALPFVVIGVGINGNVEPSGFPASIAPMATSLQHVAHKRVDLVAITDRVIAAVRHACRAFELRGKADIRAYIAHTVSIGHRVSTPDGRQGTVEAIALDGALVVRFDDGAATEEIRAGMVTHTRPPAPGEHR